MQRFGCPTCGEHFAEGPSCPMCGRPGCDVLAPEEAAGDGPMAAVCACLACASLALLAEGLDRLIWVLERVRLGRGG